VKRTRRIKAAAFALVCAVSALKLTSAEADNPDLAPPKPDDPYEGYSTTLLSDGRWLIAGGNMRSGYERRRDGSVTQWNGGFTAEARLFDSKTRNWTNTGAMSTKRVWHAATLLSDGKVLVAGGHFGGNLSDLASAEIYNPVTETWTNTGSLNTARRGHQATLLADGRVLVTGGAASRTNYPHTAYFASAELYEPEMEKWTKTTPMKVARSGHTATLLTNGLVLVAGGKDENADWLFSAELYDPNTGKWMMTGEMPRESRFFYSEKLQTNSLVLLTARSGDYTWQVTNAWEVSKLLFDPADGQWTAIGPRRPHFVSSTNLDRTLTILPESGSQFLASQEVYFLIESADRFGVTNIQLFQDGVRIVESEESPMRFTVTNQTAGTYTFLARADFANGLASTSSPVSITFEASGPEVFLAPGPTEFISERHVKSSPAILLANVVGVNPDSLTNLTLNGVPQPLRTGNFPLRAPLSDGENVFVLAATDNQGRTAKATTEVYLNTSVPTISIVEPTNGATINAVCVDVHGTFAATNLRQIRVGNPSANMEMPAFVSSNRFETRNVFLSPGTNTLSAIAEDMAGNTSTNTITIIGPTDTNLARTVPVEIKATPSGGFVPLTVTFKVTAYVPGVVQKVFYDFDGDHSYDQTHTDLRPITHTFRAEGEYFPVVTVQTSVGRFSSIGPGFWFLASTRINVQKPPVLISEIKVVDPVDLKWTATSNLYVLSGSTATLTEFNATGRVVRSLKGIGGKPTGFDVDAAGNLYIALNASNQVWKFKPTTDSFEADYAFGNSGFIGNANGSSGSKSNELSAPFDVAVANSFDGDQILISDTGNHRIERFDKSGRFESAGYHVAKDGSFVSSFGEYGTNRSQFNEPRGLGQNELREHLFIADSGNNRVAVAHASFGPLATSGEPGTALGQFRNPINVCVSERGICVADAGNDRVQIFDPVQGGEGGPLSPFPPRVAIGSEFSLKRPSAVAWRDDLLEEKIYIADTGNNRVILVKLPMDNPETVWNSMKARLLKGDIDGAVSYFASTEAEGYREMYSAIGTNDLIKTISEIPPISPISIERGEAQYYFKQSIDGVDLTFPIKFVKESGKWKIMEY
jgi:hypothetical protein